MIATTLEIEGSSGCSLLVRQWEPEEEVMGAIQIAHGMAEHSLRYEAFAGYLTDMGWAVWCHDHRQHGNSIGHDAVGILDETDSWEAMVADLSLVHETMAGRFPKLPRVIMGHSMGSLLVRCYLHSYSTELAGVILMGTPYFGKSATVAVRAMASLQYKAKPKEPSHMLSKLQDTIYSTQVKDRVTEKDWLCYDTAQVDSYIADPLCGAVYNAAFYRELSDGYLTVNDPAVMLHWPMIPTLIISGNDDPAGGMGKGPLVAHRRYRSYGVDCHLRLMPHMRHEILHEIKKEDTYEEVLIFLEKCIEEK